MHPVTDHLPRRLRTLKDIHDAASRCQLNPTTIGNDLAFDCPQCKYDGVTARATAHMNTKILLPIATCNACNDDEDILGLLAELAPTWAEVVPINPELNGHATASTRHHVTLLNLDQLLAHPPPDPDFAWGNTAGGYVEIGTCAVLHGDGGLGKSLIGQGLCRRYTLGKEWLGQATPQGGGIALYLDGENSEAEIARRLYSFQFRPGDTNLHYGRVQMPILLDPAAGEALLLQLIAETGASLIVLDSQRALWGGDEREQMEIRPLYDMLARIAENIQVAILLIHHDNKSGLYSGSTDINAAVSSRLHLERKNKDKKDRRRILWHEKSRSGPEQEPVTFSVHKNTEDILEFTIHNDDEDSSEPVGRPPKKRDELRERILRLLLDGGRFHRSDAARALGIDPSDRTFRRCWSALDSEGQIAENEDGTYELSA